MSHSAAFRFHGLIRDGAEERGETYTAPIERGVGTCESCGCECSVKPEQLEGRLVEMQAKAQQP